MHFSILSSGSKQNCFHIESGENSILIDIGITWSKAQRFVSELGCLSKPVDALFVTHEHLDHIRGIKGFSRQCPAPVYMDEASRDSLKLRLKLHEHLNEGEWVKVGVLKILPFRVNHDAVNTFGYIVEDGQRRLFLASDIGSFDERIIRLASGSHAVAIESNYDEEMLSNSFYPDALKKRIFGKNGHLSNRGAEKFLERVINPKTRHVFFLHLSENNNRIDLVERMIDQSLQSRYPEVGFHISRRESPIGPFEI